MSSTLSRLCTADDDTDSGENPPKLNIDDAVLDGGAWEGVGWGVGLAGGGGAGGGGRNGRG